MIWLITGCSSGLGLMLAEALLNLPDHKVIATSRKPPSTETAQKFSSNVNASWEILDVSSPDLEAQLAIIIAKHGPIDVLVNNAGYGLGGAFEALPLASIRHQCETNFFGPIRLMQAVLPQMRERKTGTVVNISSSEIWEAHPGISAYASSKWALEGLSQSIAGEIAAFGFRLLLVEPGNMRTAFFDPNKAAEALVPTPEVYQGTMVDYILQAVTSSHGTQRLDPRRSAGAIIREVLEPTMVNGTMVLRSPLGSECLINMEEQMKRVEKDFEAVREPAAACDFTD